MSGDHLLEDLGQLDGEELVELISSLDRQIAAATIAAARKSRNRRALDQLTALAGDLHEARTLALLQVARISVPMVEAQGIIWRARYSRGHPVRVVR